MSFHCIQYYVDQKGQEEGPILVVKNSHLNTFYLPISIFIAKFGKTYIIETVIIFFIKWVKSNRFDYS